MSQNNGKNPPSLMSGNVIPKELFFHLFANIFHPYVKQDIFFT